MAYYKRSNHYARICNKYKSEVVRVLKIRLLRAIKSA